MDTLRYQVLLNGRDITDFLASASISGAVNAIPTCSLTLNDPECWLSNKVEPDSGDIVEVKGSRDGTAPSTTLFYGVVSSSSYTTTANGADAISLSCKGGGAMSVAMVGPNQLVYKGVEVPAIFTGTNQRMVQYGDPPTYEDIGWTADPQGNYPNGLLYKTGYSLHNHAGDVIEGEVDLVSLTSFNGFTLYGAIKFVCDTYGLAFWFDDSARQLHIARTPLYGDSTTDFPSSGITFTVGVDVNSEDIMRDGALEYDKVTVVGASPELFYSIGEGARELKVQDNEYGDITTVVRKAQQLYKVRCGETRSMKITVVPTPINLVGKSITVVDPRRLDADGNPFLSLHKNVMAQTHSMSGDRWTTTLELESSRKTTGKILAEILEELERNKEISDYGRAYLTGDVATNANITDNPNICAIGFGTSDASSNSDLVSGKIIKPITEVANIDVGHTHVFGKLTLNEMRGRLREIVLYGNNLDHNMTTKRKTWTLPTDPSTPATISHADGSTGRYLKLMDIYSGPIFPHYRYPLKVEDASGDLNLYGAGEFSLVNCWVRGVDATITDYTSTTSDNAYMHVPRAIKGTWPNYEWDFTPEWDTDRAPVTLYRWSNKKGISTYDDFDGNKPSHIVNCKFIKSVQNGRDIYRIAFTQSVLLDFDTRIQEGAQWGIKSMCLMLKAKAPYDTLRAYIYKPFSNEWGLFGEGRNKDIFSIQYDTYDVYPEEDLHPYFTNDGHLYVLLVNWVSVTVYDVNPDPEGKGRDMGITIQYAGLSFMVDRNNLYVPKYVDVWEIAKLDSDMSFTLQCPPHRILGLYDDWVQGDWVDEKTNIIYHYKPRKVGLLPNPNRIELLKGKTEYGGRLRTYDEMYEKLKPEFPSATQYPSGLWNGAGMALQKELRRCYTDPINTAERRGGFLVHYTTMLEPNKQTIPANLYSISPSSFHIKHTSGDLRTGEVWIKCNDNMPCFGAQIGMTLSCVGGEPVARLRTGRPAPYDDRLDQGIEMDGMREAYVAVRLDTTKTNGGQAYLSGSGVEKPVL